MAQFVEPDRLWPLLAYFTAAVVLVVSLELLGSWMHIGSGARVGLVLAWIVLLPLGAWIVWRRTDPGGE